MFGGGYPGSIFFGEATFSVPSLTNDITGISTIFNPSTGVSAVIITGKARIARQPILIRKTIFLRGQARILHQ